MTSAPDVIHNPGARRFESAVDGHLGVAEYRLTDGVMHMTHTEVPAALQGRGIAAALIAAAVRYARDEGLKINPLCSYVHAYMRKHADTHDLLLRPPAAAQRVLDFWFGVPGSAEHRQVRDVWFRKSDAFDRSIAEQFGHEIDAALRGDLQEWDATPEGALARIVVLDQFTRNVFRNTPRAFAGDAQALELARRLVRHAFDQRLPLVQRWFVYMPFEHAEDMAAQDESVQLFDALARAGSGFESALDYAHRHRDVIARFGRFPHRNAILERKSTPAEQEYLSQPGAGF